MALDRLYQQLVLEHNRAPRNFGRLPGATHAARGQDALCGDDILFELRVRDGRVEAAGFSGEACAITKASASLLTEWLDARAVESLPGWQARFEALMSDPERDDDPEFGAINQLRAVAAFPARVRNALLPWQAMRQALDQAPAGN